MTAEEIEKGFQAFQHNVSEWALRKGWLIPGEKRNPLELLMLVTTELAEAAEAFRHNNPKCSREGMEQFTHAEEELADAVIRIFQMAGEYGFDLGAALTAKMAFNEGRPVRHGGKAF